jgi:hypothetical protein
MKIRNKCVYNAKIRKRSVFLSKYKKKKYIFNAKSMKKKCVFMNPLLNFCPTSLRYFFSFNNPEQVDKNIYR